MKIVLREEVDNLGRRGQVVTVAAGTVLSACGARISEAIVRGGRPKRGTIARVTIKDGELEVILHTPHQPTAEPTEPALPTRKGEKPLTP